VRLTFGEPEVDLMGDRGHLLSVCSEWYQDYIRGIWPIKMLPFLRRQTFYYIYYNPTFLSVCIVSVRLNVSLS
jgi:hypothetical protein